MVVHGRCAKLSQIADKQLSTPLLNQFCLHPAEHVAFQCRQRSSETRIRMRGQPKRLVCTTAPATSGLKPGASFANRPGDPGGQGVCPLYEGNRRSLLFSGICCESFKVPQESD